MIRVLCEMLLREPGDEERGAVIQRIEGESGHTIRSSEEESALRRLAQLADVKSFHGYGEEISIDDGSFWSQANFCELRRRARMRVTELELCEFLSDA